MRAVTFKVIPLKSYIIYLAMLPQLEKFMEKLYNLLGNAATTGKIYGTPV